MFYFFANIAISSLYCNTTAQKKMGLPNKLGRSTIFGGL